MTLPVSILLIAVGAILVWGVTADAQGINVDAVGVILMVVGLVGVLLSLIYWDRWGWGAWTHRHTVVEGGPAVRRRYVEPASRATIVEEEVEDYPAPPPAAPPPPP
jgi:membrane protein YdbS with pleckstrin-like domain